MIVNRIDTLDPATWTPVIPPANCDNVAISNREASAPLRVRTSLGSQATEFSIPTGSEQGIAAPMNHSERLFRFLAGEVAFYMKPDAGTGPVILLWA